MQMLTWALVLRSSSRKETALLYKSFIQCAQTPEIDWIENKSNSSLIFISSSPIFFTPRGHFSFWPLPLPAFQFSNKSVPILFISSFLPLVHICISQPTNTGIHHRALSHLKGWGKCLTVNKTAETLNQKEMFCFFAYIGVWDIILIATSVNSLWATAPTHIGKVNYNMPHLSVSAVNPSGLIPLQIVHSNGIAYYYILNMTSLHLCNLSGLCFDLKVLLFLLFIYTPPLIHYGWYML